MIIRCRKCETRFRFDETLIVGDGVWVRCSRCQNVFFQEAASGEPAPPAAAQEVPSIRISDARRPSDERFPPLRVEEEQEAKPPLRETVWEADEPEAIVKAVTREGAEEEPEKAPFGDDGPAIEREIPAEPGEDDEPLGLEPERKRGAGAVLKIAALIVFALLVVAGVYLWLFPEVRTQALEGVTPWLRTIPGVEQLLGKEAAKKGEAASPILIKEIRQRTVTNLLSGNLRILEGVAVNQSKTPLARIRVRLVISDAYDVILGERTVFCGNLLTDVELSTLAEPEIQRELSVPQGSDVANERIAPGGEIPFMIVFGQEQAGAIKTIILPAGADRVQ